MTGDVDVQPEVVAPFAAHVNVAVREEELVELDRRPADEEDQEDGHQHFDGLFIKQSCVIRLMWKNDIFLNRKGA